MSNSASYINIHSSQAGQKLLAFLRRNLRTCSGAPLPPGLLHRLVRSGQIRVNKGRVKPSHILHEDDMLRIPPLERVILPPQTEVGAESAGGEAEIQNGGITGGADESGPETWAESGQENWRQIGSRIKLKCPELGVIAETASLLALNKPSGLPVHGGSKHDRSVISLVLECAGGAIGFEPAFTPTLAHRLDKDTSGVLLVAKTYAFLRLAQDSLRESDPEKRARKFYLAWVAGAWPQAGLQDRTNAGSKAAYDANLPAGTVELEDRLLKKADAKGAEKVNLSGNGEGALCKSRVEALARKPGATLLRVELLTGRTHQIRVQLASRGFPIIGDLKYGGSPPACGASDPSVFFERFGAGRGMLLHSYIFSLPCAGLEFTAPPPWRGGFAVNLEQVKKFCDAPKTFDLPPRLR